MSWITDEIANRKKEEEDSIRIKAIKESSLNKLVTHVRTVNDSLPQELKLKAELYENCVEMLCNVKQGGVVASIYFYTDRLHLVFTPRTIMDVSWSDGGICYFIKYKGYGDSYCIKGNVANDINLIVNAIVQAVVTNTPMVLYRCMIF